MKEINNKKALGTILVLIVVIVSIIIVTIIRVKNENDIEEVVQLTGKVIEEKQTNEYKINNIKILANQDRAEITLTIKNITDTEIMQRDIWLKYLNKQKNEIGKTRIHLPEMQAEQEITLSTIITKDLKRAIDYKIEY